MTATTTTGHHHHHHRSDSDNNKKELFAGRCLVLVLVAGVGSVLRSSWTTSHTRLASTTKIISNNNAATRYGRNSTDSRTSSPPPASSSPSPSSLRIRSDDGRNVTDAVEVPFVPTQPITIVCQLSGEMCNNIGKWAHCYALKLWLERESFHGNTNITIAIRHQDHRKWTRGRNDLQQCWPFSRGYSFEATSESLFSDNKGHFFNQLRLQYEQITGWPRNDSDTLTPFDGVNSDSYEEIHEALQLFVETARNEQQQSQQQLLRYLESDSSSTASVNGTNGTNSSAAPSLSLAMLSSESSPSSPTPSVPLFLYANRQLEPDIFVNRYYDDFRKYFRYDLDSKDCCALVPDPDESVFHYRNFLTEMPRKGKQFGFEELGPNQTAEELFGHLEAGSKVAIVTRYYSPESTQPYVDAMTRRGLQVRLVQNQSGVQDFCFLLHARKEMVGFIHSTFFLWAALLSVDGATNVVAYSLNTTEQIRLANYNWTNPSLRSRFQFRVLTPWRENEDDTGEDLPFEKAER